MSRRASHEEAALFDHVARGPARRRARGARPRRRLPAGPPGPRGAARASCWPATSTPCRRRTTSRAAATATRVHGLGAADMKGALAVMIELALARRAPTPSTSLRLLPARGAAVRRHRADAAAGARARRRATPTSRRDGADGQRVHAGCLGNVNATLDLPRAQRPTPPGRGWPTTRSSAPAA